MLKKPISVFTIVLLVISFMSLSIASQQSQGTKKVQGTIVKKDKKGESKTVILQSDSGRKLTLIARDDTDLENINNGTKVDVKFTPRNHIIKSISTQ